MPKGHLKTIFATFVPCILILGERILVDAYMENLGTCNR